MITVIITIILTIIAIIIIITPQPCWMRGSMAVYRTQNEIGSTSKYHFFHVSSAKSPCWTIPVPIPVFFCQGHPHWKIGEFRFARPQPEDPAGGSSARRSASPAPVAPAQVTDAWLPPRSPGHSPGAPKERDERGRCIDVRCHIYIYIYVHIWSHMYVIIFIYLSIYLSIYLPTYLPIYI